MTGPRPEARRGATALTAAAGIGGLLVVGATVIGLSVAGELGRASAAWCLGLDGATVLLMAAGTALWTRTRSGARILGAPTTRPAAAPGGPPRAAGFEPVELLEHVDSLLLRLRVAEEQEKRQRTVAEQSGAGVFELLAGLTDAEEGARGQLSAELHDTVAQSLALARMRLADGADRDAADLLEEADDQVRALMARTRPPALRDGDLGSAVGALCDEVRRRYGLVVRVSWPERPVPIPLATAVIVYRFFQESLLNVAKHAEVDDAATTLAVDDTALVATVSDAGTGFDPTAVRSTGGRHVGLGLLRERVRLAGGSVEVHSAVGAGTTLTLRLPRSHREGSTAVVVPDLVRR